jgi:spore coat protein U-like protein
MRGVRWLVSLGVLTTALFLCEGSAKAQATCTITTTSVAFGIYNVFSTSDLASTGSVTYYCRRRAANITVWLDKGIYGLSNNPRQMASGTNRLNYNLFLDANHTQIWGNPNPYRYGPITPPNRTYVTLTVYALISAGQDVPAGTYSDSATVTINF